MVLSYNLKSSVQICCSRDFPYIPNPRLPPETPIDFDRVLMPKPPSGAPTRNNLLSSQLPAERGNFTQTQREKLCHIQEVTYPTISGSLTHYSTCINYRWRFPFGLRFTLALQFYIFHLQEDLPIIKEVFGEPNLELPVQYTDFRLPPCHSPTQSLANPPTKPPSKNQRTADEDGRPALQRNHKLSMSSLDVQVAWNQEM